MFEVIEGNWVFNVQFEGRKQQPMKNANQFSHSVIFIQNHWGESPAQRNTGFWI